MDEIGVGTIDPARYAKLLAKTRPKVIEDEREYERLAGELEKLDFAKNAPIPEQQALASVLAKLIEEYEDRRYPIPEAPLRDVLQFLME